MRVPLIAALDANTPETRSFPATDASAGILFSKMDGRISEHYVDKVDCRDFTPGARSEIGFWLDGVKSLSWRVYVTDNRIIVWNACTKGLMGKAKEKPGKASAGHLYYNTIANLSAFCDPSGVPVLIVSCFRQDGMKTAFSIVSPDVQAMRRLASELHDRIDAWIVNFGRKLDRANTTSDKQMKALDGWDSFTSHLWEKRDSSVTVFVPCSSWDKVADSRAL